MDPNTPRIGIIESFSLVDGTGSIRLEDGSEVRFGRSASTFEPVPGTRVEVLAVAPGFRGALKATAMRLAEDRAVHANRIGARDASAGAQPATLSGNDFAREARERAGLTVLFDEDIPRDLGGLLKWALSFGLDAHGITVDLQHGLLVFDVKGAKIRALFGHDPYPLSELDRGDLGPRFTSGKSAVALLFGFMPRNYYTQTPDAWNETGHARAMSRLAKVLLVRGHSVIVHRAHEMVVPGPRFMARLGQLDDPDSVPFAAWVDLREVEEGAAFASFGLRAFGLPEVRIEGRVEPGSWVKPRRFEAALFACYCLCRGMWIKDGLFEVPRRIQIGSVPPMLLDPVDVERWSAKVVGAEIDQNGVMAPMILTLRHREDSDDVGALWAAASRPSAGDPAKLGQGGYEALFLHSFMSWLYLGQVGMISCLRARVPHRIITLRGDGPHLVLTSSGIGRVPQPGGDRRLGNDHIEVIAFVPPDRAPMIVEAIAIVADTVHAPDRRTLLEPWGLYPTSIATFLLRPWGPLAMGPGAPLTLLELVPLDESELASAQQNPQARPQLLGPYDQAASAVRWSKLKAFTPPTN